jgi:hypothetical protein
LAAPEAKRSREHDLWLVRDGSYFEIVFGSSSRFSRMEWSGTKGTLKV